jgi:hypothetical protein
VSDLITHPAITVLAAGNALGNLIYIVIGTITLIGYVMNFVNSRTQQKPPQNRGNRPPARPRNEKIQSEIEQFMRDQANRRKQGTTGASPAPPRPEPARAPAPQAKAVPRRVGKPQKPQPSQAAQPASARAGGSTQLGQSVREHVRSAMSERVQNQADKYLASNVDTLASHHLGHLKPGLGDAAAIPVTKAVALSPTEILKDLRTAEGVRKAFILNEILQRPGLNRRRV